jgi:hypothetical protein
MISIRQFHLAIYFSKIDRRNRALYGGLRADVHKNRRFYNPSGERKSTALCFAASF